MATLAEVLTRALALHQSGDLAGAERLYDLILSQLPDEPDTLHLSGVLAFQTGRAALGAERIEAALRHAPALTEAHNNLGAVLASLGDRGAAAAASRRAVALQPDHRDALFRLAELTGDAIGFRRCLRLDPRHRPTRLALAAVDPAMALPLLHGLAAFEPDGALAWANLARLAGDRAALFRRALILDPAQPDLHEALARLGGGGAARRRALALAPAFGTALVNHAALLTGTSRRRWAERAVRAAPGDPAAWVNCGSARGAGGAGALRRAAALDPARTNAWLGLAQIAAEDSRVEDAARAYDRVLALCPDDIAALTGRFNMASLAADLDRAARLAAAIRSALAPDAITDWRLAGQLIYLGPYIGLDPARLRALGRQCGALLSAEAGPASLPPAPRRPLPPVRVGLVSPDLGNRPMGQVLRGVLQAHDPAALEIRGYALVDRAGDPGTHYRDLVGGMAGYRDLAGLSDDEARTRIAADQLDVLVDLTGFMQHARPALFAGRPAPVQLYWIGHHGGGLSLPFFDYLLADDVVLPPGAEAVYAEAAVRLPVSYHPADRPALPDIALARRDFGLPDEAIVFCAFNNPQKIDGDCLDAWAEILRAVPGSVLWLSNPHRLPATAVNLRAAAARRGVAPDRLVFAGFVADKAVHFLRHRLADLFLDAFRATASTTALDALWAGLPVLTRAGQGVGQRIATSMVTALGMPEMSRPDSADFVATAIALAHDRAELARRRARLAALRDGAPLFDPGRSARHLATAFAEMARRARAGLAPAPFRIGEDGSVG